MRGAIYLITLSQNWSNELNQDAIRPKSEHFKSQEKTNEFYAEQTVCVTSESSTIHIYMLVNIASSLRSCELAQSILMGSNKIWVCSECSP